MGSRDKSFHRFIEDIHGRHGGSPESEGRPGSDNSDAGEGRERHRKRGESKAAGGADAHPFSQELARDHKPVRGDEDRPEDDS